MAIWPVSVRSDPRHIHQSSPNCLIWTHLQEGRQMNEIHFVAALLTMAMQNTPERQHPQVVRDMNVYDRILRDYNEVYCRLSTRYPALRTPREQTQVPSGV